jgi:hypothetical protein
MTSIDLEKIWLWISDESRAHEKIEDKTISPEDGVAYVERWLTAVSSGQLFRVSRAMAERGEQELAEELEQRAIERQRGEERKKHSDKTIKPIVSSSWSAITLTTTSLP